MRYPPKKWKSVAILMRDSAYSVLEVLTRGPRGWTELRDYAELTDGGLQKVLKELIKSNVVVEVLIKKESGFKDKKYALNETARKEKIFEKAKELKESLERVGQAGG